MSVAVSIRMPDELIRELDSVAKTTERSRSFHIQKALEIYLEDQADLQIALDRLHDSSDPIISIDEMRNELNV
ncbi:MAG: ribbon-helix-helix domain-containing protein [Desulfobacula sp.]|jgi:RHH-type rel operon transcriptional repressor/antitoxin RelB|nr:ribbon-helix-helix domain-containing protein [Desulfobacula sp.]